MVYKYRMNSGYLHVVLGIGDCVCIPLGVGTLCNKHTGMYIHVCVYCTITMVCSLEFFLCWRFFWSFYPFWGEMAARRMLMIAHKLPQLADEYLWRGSSIIHSDLKYYSVVACSITSLAHLSYLEIVHRSLSRLYVVCHSYEYTMTAAL